MTTVGSDSAFTVAFRVDGAPGFAHRAAVAVVPGRFRPLDGPMADVVVVGSSDGGWPERVPDAVREGVRGVMVAGRSTASTAAAHAALEYAATAGIPVVLHTPHAATVAWRSVVAEVIADASRASILDSVVTWSVGDTDQAGASRRALLDQLAVVRPLIGDSLRLRTIHDATGSYEIAGEAGLVTRLTGIGAPVRDSRLDLDLVSADCRWRIRFDAGAAARPVVIQRMDRDGVRQSSLRFESGARACWVALHEQLTGIAPVTVDAEYLADLDVANHLLPT